MCHRKLVVHRNVVHFAKLHSRVILKLNKIKWIRLIMTTVVFLTTQKRNNNIHMSSVYVRDFFFSPWFDEGFCIRKHSLGHV